MDPFDKNIYTVLNFVSGKSNNSPEVFNFAVNLTSEEKKLFYDCIENLSSALEKLNDNEGQFLLNSIHDFKMLESEAENSDNIKNNSDIKIVLGNMLKSIKQECKEELKLIPRLVEKIQAKELENKRVLAAVVEKTFLRAKAINWIRPNDDSIYDKKKLNELVEDYFLIFLEEKAKAQQMYIEEMQKYEDRVVSCSMDEAVFTNALDPRPIVATKALGPCIGIAGYEPDSHSGFVIHVSNRFMFQRSEKMLTEKVKHMAASSKSPIQIHLRSSMSSDSNPHTQLIEKWIESMCNADCPMVVKSKKMASQEGNIAIQTLSLDTRTGEVSIYYPRSNNVVINKNADPDRINIIYG